MYQFGRDITAPPKTVKQYSGKVGKDYQMIRNYD